MQDQDASCASTRGVTHAQPAQGHAGVCKPHLQLHQVKRGYYEADACVKAAPPGSANHDAPPATKDDDVPEPTSQPDILISQCNACSLASSAPPMRSHSSRLTHSSTASSKVRPSSLPLMLGMDHSPLPPGSCKHALSAVSGDGRASDFDTGRAVEAAGLPGQVQSIIDASAACSQQLTDAGPEAGPVQAVRSPAALGGHASFPFAPGPRMFVPLDPAASRAHSEGLQRPRHHVLLPAVSHTGGAPCHQINTAHDSAPCAASMLPRRTSHRQPSCSGQSLGGRERSEGGGTPQGSPAAPGLYRLAGRSGSSHQSCGSPNRRVAIQLPLSVAQSAGCNGPESGGTHSPEDRGPSYPSFASPAAQHYMLGPAAPMGVRYRREGMPSGKRGSRGLLGEERSGLVAMLNALHASRESVRGFLAARSPSVNSRHSREPSKGELCHRGSNPAALTASPCRSGASGSRTVPSEQVEYGQEGEGDSGCEEDGDDEGQGLSSRASTHSTSSEPVSRATSGSSSVHGASSTSGRSRHGATTWFAAPASTLVQGGGGRVGKGRMYGHLDEGWANLLQQLRSET